MTGATKADRDNLLQLLEMGSGGGRGGDDGDYGGRDEKTGGRAG